jgi:hypothetical protein
MPKWPSTSLFPTSNEALYHPNAPSATLKPIQARLIEPQYGDCGTERASLSR